MKRPSFFLITLSVLVLLASVSWGQGDTISTYIGVVPQIVGMTTDAAGNIYYTDIHNNEIKKISPSLVVTIIAGNGTLGYSGDGGPATAAEFDLPEDVFVDSIGNIYVADCYNNVIRKINTSGVITTIAGTGALGPGGDGGPATAATLSNPMGVVIDKAGNMYIVETCNVRKINTSGIISTIAGIGTWYGESGDGGPATAAYLCGPQGIAVDPIGNIYITEEASTGMGSRIREIDTAGIINTIAGTGAVGYTGDGGFATLAELNSPYHIKIDIAGNIFFSDGSNTVRKISPSGIINTIAGNGVAGYSGDGGPATLASLHSPCGIAFDKNHNLYIADNANNVVRKVGLPPDITADSFYVFLYDLCGGAQFSTVTTDPNASSLLTWFGDGTQVTNTLITGVPGDKYANVYHDYNAPGIYTIKEMLMRGTTKVDSASFSYQYMLCNSFAVRFYFDANGDCIKDSSEPYNYLPIATEVDSNGIAIDTISTTSGFNYTGYGNPGDIYSFKILSTPAGFIPTCGGSGIISDTLDSVNNNMTTNYIGFVCASATGFDLAENVSLITGRHIASGVIDVYNNYCTPENGVVTMNFSSKYDFQSSTPTPTSIVGNTVTWDFGSLSAYLPPNKIQFTLAVPGTWLIPGDTIQSSYVVTPIIGDLDSANNFIIIVNTITGSWDPNEMAVNPSGYISAGTQLQYTIQFENTGNDTAFNISVYDTLSDYVDVSSLRMVAASAVMNTDMLKYNGHNVVKFDFPNINLLDSVYQNQCSGMLIFNINTLSGLPNGTTIFNHAGIFFDDNPAVITDTVEDIIGVPPTGIATINNASKVSIYPNPANDALTIKLDNGSYNTATITNIVGQEVMIQQLIGTQTIVNVSKLPVGMYYVTLRGDSGMQVLKFEKI